MLMPPAATLVTPQIPIPAQPEVRHAAPSQTDEPIPDRVPDARAQVALKMMEMINRYLLSAETMPRQTLLRLFETVATALSLTPMPQETLRDFGKRIALALESLPADARAALEKTLAQRSTTLTVRTLLALLNQPSADTPPRAMPTVPLPERSTAQSLSPRPLLTTAAMIEKSRGMPEQVAPPRPSVVQAAPLPSPTNDARMTATLTASLQLQQALKKAFGPDAVADPIVPMDDGDHHAEPPAPAASSASSGAGKSPSNKSPASPMASPVTGQPTTPGDKDDIPLLRTAIAFLAHDADALAQANALARPPLSDDLRAELVDTLGLAPPEPDDTGGPQHPLSGSMPASQPASAQSRADTSIPGSPDMLAQRERSAFPDEQPALFLEADTLSDALSLLAEAIVEPAPDASAPLATAFAQAADLEALEALSGFEEQLDTDMDAIMSDLSGKHEEVDIADDVDRRTTGAVPDADERRHAYTPQTDQDLPARDALPLRLADGPIMPVPIAFISFPYLPAGDSVVESPDEEDEQERGFTENGDEDEQQADDGDQTASDEDGHNAPALDDDKHGTDALHASAKPDATVDTYRLMSGLD